MRTVYLNGKFLARRLTGVQRVARCLLTALDTTVAGSDVRWVLLRPPGAAAPALRNVGVRCVAGGPLHLWEQVALPWAARDGLLVNLAGSAPAFAGRQIVTFHDAAVFDEPEAYAPVFRRWYRWLFRRLGRRAVALLTVSVFSQSALARALGVPPHRIAVLRNGADHLIGIEPDACALADHGLAGVRYLLAVASANPAKNLDMLVRAFALRGQRDLRLVIAGGESRHVFARGSARGPSDGGVLRLGVVEDPLLKALYRGAVALAFPSRYEGFGLPPLEAMAEGCPVMAADAAALPETCGDAAWLLPAGDDTAWTTAIDRIASDPLLRADLQARGRARVACFRWAETALALRRLVEAHV